MIDRRQRDLGQWFSVGGKIVAFCVGLISLLAFGSRAAETIRIAQASAVGIDSVKDRVVHLEKRFDDIGYMTCVMFADTHPQRQVPASCKEYTK